MDRTEKCQHCGAFNFVVVNNINWRPMAEMPDALMDGRDVLMWVTGSASVAYYGKPYGLWIIEVTCGDDIPEVEPTHFCPISAPEADQC